MLELLRARTLRASLSLERANDLLLLYAGMDVTIPSWSPRLVT